MRASLVFLVSALSAGVHSFDTQQVLGSANPVGTSYQCQNGATPVAACTDPSNVPTCSCSCSNGVTYNEPLSAHTSKNPNPFPDTCQAEKDDCLERENTLKTQVTEAQNKHAECEAKATADQQKAELDFLQMEQSYKVQLSGKDAELSQCKQNSIKDLSAANDACKAKENELNTKFSSYWKNNYRYFGCFTDSNSRVLSEYSKFDENITLNKCASICQDYTYFGVEMGRECYCGNSIRNGHKSVGGGECSVKCKGNNGQICGGPWRASIFTRS